MDNTYLTLRGWRAYLIEINEMQRGYYVQNLAFNVSFNIQGQTDALPEEFFKGNDLSIYFSRAHIYEVPDTILQKVLDFEKELTSTTL